ncbi:MAG: SDR family oxidoreductase, partial [Candidatus Thorarchaeota archaeon]
KIVLITGGNRGIGFEICHQLSKKGFSVILTARDEDKGKIAQSQLENEGLKVDFHQLDVTDIYSINEAFIFVKNKFNTLNILINNAGILIDRGKSILNVDIDVVRKTMETNMIGPLNLIQTFLPLLKKSKDARIINVSSGLGSFHESMMGSPAYSLSKAALNMLTLKMSMQLPRDIKIYAMTPGWVRTDMGGQKATRTVEEGADTAVWLSIANNIPSGRFYRDRQETSW